MQVAREAQRFLRQGDTKLLLAQVAGKAFVRLHPCWTSGPGQLLQSQKPSVPLLKNACGVADVFTCQEFCNPRAQSRSKPQEFRPKCQSPRLGTRRPRRRRLLLRLRRRGLRSATKDAEAQAGSRQADDHVQHEFKSVQALRGRESSAKAKWQDQGWEFVSENRGTLRTELNFRRVKPKTFGAHLLSIVATFRRMQPKTQLVLVASCALILVAGIIGIVVGTQSGGDTPKPSAAQTTASTAPPAEPTAQNDLVIVHRIQERVVLLDNLSKLGKTAADTKNMGLWCDVAEQMSPLVDANDTDVEKLGELVTAESQAAYNTTVSKLKLMREAQDVINRSAAGMCA